MANGSVALRLVESLAAPEPLSAPSHATTAQPSAATELALELAVATIAVAQAMLDFQASGDMTHPTRALGGEVLAKICMLRLEHELDLPAAVAGAKRMLRQRHAADWQKLHGTEFPEAALDTFVSWVLAITDRVVAGEQALARAVAH